MSDPWEHWLDDDQPEWDWVRHGDGWALMQGRCSHMHGLNKLTVRSDGFDRGGDELRELTARLLNEEANRVRDGKPTYEALTVRVAELEAEVVRLRSEQSWRGVFFWAPGDRVDTP